MAKRKAPLSAEEKRSKLLELFHESVDVYQLKDIERLAPKEKGIVLQSVKGCLQDLVDGGLVNCEKIAGSLYYWSFPSEALQSVKRQVIENERMSIELQEKINKAQKRMQEVSTSQGKAEQIDSLEAEIDELKKEKTELQQRIATSIGEMNYDDIEAKQADSKKLLEAANRWTDNIFSTKTWCKRKFGKEDKEMDKAFGIPDDLDYLEA